MIYQGGNSREDLKLHSYVFRTVPADEKNPFSIIPPMSRRMSLYLLFLRWRPFSELPTASRAKIQQRLRRYLGSASLSDARYVHHSKIMKASTMLISLHSSIFHLSGRRSGTAYRRPTSNTRTQHQQLEENLTQSAFIMTSPFFKSRSTLCLLNKEKASRRAAVVMLLIMKASLIWKGSLGPPGEPCPKREVGDFRSADKKAFLKPYLRCISLCFFVFGSPELR